MSFYPAVGPSVFYSFLVAAQKYLSLVDEPGKHTRPVQRNKDWGAMEQALGLGEQSEKFPGERKCLR